MVYAQTNAEDPFFYMISDIYDDFKIGCPALWKLDEMIEEAKSNPEDDQYSFFNRYHKL
jgi:hypothetical protein